jgi:hypothetical protein
MNCNVFIKLSKVQAASLLVSTLPMQGSKASSACEGGNPGGRWDGGRIDLPFIWHKR